MTFISSRHFNFLSTCGSAALWYRPFGSENRFCKRFKCQCGFGWSAASKVTCKNWRKTLEYFFSFVYNGTLNWGSGYCIADKIEWDVKETQWLDKTKSQQVVSNLQHTFPDAVLTSILIIASNSPVIWTQSLEALHTTCLIDVSGGWPMVFHSFWEMMVMSEGVSICKRTGWLFSFTDTFPVWLSLGEKLLPDCVFFSVCVYVVACLLFCALMGCRNLCVLAGCICGCSVFWMDISLQNASQHNSSKQMEVSFMLS